MYSCREAARLSSLAMEQPLPGGQRARLWFHLAMCRGCDNFARQIAFLREAGRRLPRALERGER
jgi:hypothetical protein